EATGAGPPEVLEPDTRLRLFDRLAGVAGVDEHVGVNEDGHGRAGPPAWDRQSAVSARPSPTGRGRRSWRPRILRRPASVPAGARPAGSTRSCRAGPPRPGPSGPSPRRVPPSRSVVPRNQCNTNLV